jgi:hypothetical protein
MRRVSIISGIVNLAALVLLGTTVAAIATPSGPEDLFGTVFVFDGSSLTLNNAFISTLNVFTIGSSNAYAVYATVSGALDSSVMSGLQIIGYVLESVVQSLPDLSSDFSFPSLAVIDVAPFLQRLGDVSFEVQSVAAAVPEPSGIAIVVTAVAGLATVLRRRKLRRGE